MQFACALLCQEKQDSLLELRDDKEVKKLAKDMCQCWNKSFRKLPNALKTSLRQLVILEKPITTQSKKFMGMIR
jgi:hypothetical protein